MSDGNGKAKKAPRVAKHDLLDSHGNIVDAEEQAFGMRYTLLANQQQFDYQFGKNADMDRMLAVFGAKTLATNESSQERNSLKGAASADEQMQAVRDRFAGLETGQWVDRTREGPTVDKDALAEAMCRVFVRQGKKTEDEITNGYKAQIRQKLDDDTAYMRKARQVPDFAAEYSAIVGRTVATVDDMLA